MEKQVFALNANLHPALKDEGKLIGALEIQGTERIKKEVILAKILQKKGSLLSLKLVKSDLQTIFKMGYFETMNAQYELLPSGKVRLVYSLKEKPIISKIEFQGCKRISEKDLKEALSLKPGSIADACQIQQGRIQLQEYCQLKQFYLAQIDYEICSTERKDEVRVIYKIKESEKVKIKKITFLNRTRFNEKILKSIFRNTQEEGFLSFLTGSGAFKDSNLQQDLQLLHYWYLDHGFIHFSYQPPLIQFSEDKRWLYLSIILDEGEQYFVDAIRFSGDLDVPISQLYQSLSLKGKEVFRISKQRADLQALTEQYQNLGYAFVNVIPQSEVNEEKKKISINYRIEKGKRFYIRNINIVGNKKTFDHVIRRELKIQEGELYHATLLKRSQRAIEQLGYFEKGEVHFHTRLASGGRSNEVDIEIQVKEGGGTGAFNIQFAWANSFIQLGLDYKDINFTGRGWSFDISIHYFPGRNAGFNFDFVEPYFLSTLWSTQFLSYWLHYRIPKRWKMEKKGLGIKAGYPINESLRTHVAYKLEKLKGSEPEDKKNTTLQKYVRLDQGLISSVTFSLEHDTRNHRLDTSRGMFHEFSVEVAGLGGNVQLLKPMANLRFYYPVIGSLVFRNNTQLGYIWEYGMHPTPPALAFYLGGSGNLRGYEDFMAGSVENGIGVGGNVQFVSIFELEYPIVRELNLKGVAFFDMGSVGKKKIGNLKMDAGLGIRVLTPFGLVRLEGGYPFEQGKSACFHFAFGLIF